MIKLIKLMARLIIFFDDILIMGASIEELIVAQDSLIYVLQGLGFLINTKTLVLEPCQTLELLGMEINLKEMILTLPEEKKNKIVEQRQFLLRIQRVTIRELPQVIHSVLPPWDQGGDDFCVISQAGGQLLNFKSQGGDTFRDGGRGEMIFMTNCWYFHKMLHLEFYKFRLWRYLVFF